MMIKNKLKIFACLAFLGFGIAMLSSCHRGSGCPAENANTKPNRKGEYSNRKGSTNLFPKDMRRKTGH